MRPVNVTPSRTVLVARTTGSTSFTFRRPLRPKYDPHRIGKRSAEPFVSPHTTFRGQYCRSLPPTEQQPAEENETAAKMSDLVIFSTQGCQYCRRAKAALDGAGIPYQDIDLSMQLDALGEVKKATGRNTVPQVYNAPPSSLFSSTEAASVVCVPQSQLLISSILQVFVDGRLIGGASETLELLASGELQKIVAGATKPALPNELNRILASSSASPPAEVSSLITIYGQIVENCLKCRCMPALLRFCRQN